MRCLPIIFLADTSGRMRGDRISAVNDSISRIIVNFRQDPYALETICASVATFNMKFTEGKELSWLDEFEYTGVEATPSTPAMLGNAISCLADWLTTRIAKTSPTCPKGDFKGSIYILWGGGLGDPHEFESATKKLDDLNMDIIVIPFSTIIHTVPASWKFVSPDDAKLIAKMPFNHLFEDFDGGSVPVSAPVQKLTKLPKEIIISF